MDKLLHIISGGFLAGKRTYLLGALLALQAIVQYLIGEMTLPQLLEQLPQILEGLGFMTLRAGFKK